MNFFTRSASTLACALLLICHAYADAPVYRSSWVVGKIYNYNHPFATKRSDDLATKMAKMQTSPFVFYRGTAHLFYEDMNSWKPSAYTSYATRNTWINGDMHMANMGAFRDAAGNFVFDTSDFDEGYWGQYVWDVRRMVVSIMLAAQENGLSSTNQEQLVREFLDAYLAKIEDFRDGNEELNYRLSSGNTSDFVNDLIKKSAGKTRQQLLNKTTSVTAGNRKFTLSRELVKLPPADYAALEAAISDYVYSIPLSKRQEPPFYKVKDICLKLGSGVGNLGRNRYYALIQGTTMGTDDDVILQIKQHSPSVVSIAAKDAMPTWAYENHEGQRVARSLKASLTYTDVLTGWTTIAGAPYSVREKSPYETDLDSTSLKTYSKFSGTVQNIGKVLAKNHAISDKDYDAALSPYNIDKEIADVITSKSGFKDEITEFAKQYAQQVQWDWTAFVEARKAGIALY